ncbi:hypothetical protein GW813_05890 [bacterium]|nr:hypothetical protein [bacterium]
MDQQLVKIRFEGRTLTCRAGTTVAAALWENGIRTLSHSPKYGRPRGLTCARGHCTACLMRVDGEPNVRTCERQVREGLEVLRQDSGAFYGPVMQKTLAAGSRLIPVGFYYKWFTRPPFVSRMFLRGIRPLTGIGRLPDAHAELVPAVPAVPAAGLERWDTVIVGGGASGLEAAAATEGSVLILDDQEAPGGHRGLPLDMVAAAGLLEPFPVLAASYRRLQAARQAFAERTGATFRGRTKAIAGYRPRGLLLREDDRLMTVECGRLVWAAGAWDALGLFPGNDLPGLIGPRALYRILARDGLKAAGSRALVVGSGRDFWLSATLLAAAGATPTLILTGGGDQEEVAGAVARKWSLHTGLILGEIRSQGETRLSASFIPSGRSARSGSHLDLETDMVVVCAPGKPAYDIPYQLGRDYHLGAHGGHFLPTGCEGRATTGQLPGGLMLEIRGEAAGPGGKQASTP